MSEIKNIELLAAIELGKRIYSDPDSSLLIEFTNPFEIVKYFNDYYKDKKQEEFYVVFLDNKKKIY